MALDNQDWVAQSQVQNVPLLSFVAGTPTARSSVMTEGTLVAAPGAGKTIVVFSVDVIHQGGAVALTDYSGRVYWEVRDGTTHATVCMGELTPDRGVDHVSYVGGLPLGVNAAMNMAAGGDWADGGLRMVVGYQVQGG